jgi:ligand-binding sensor domain-containing protein
MFKKIFIVIFLGLITVTELFSQNYFFRKYSIEEGLPQSSVHCLLQDSRGFIWMGTAGGGLTRFDGQTFESFSKADGLSDNVVRSLFEDRKGNIWIGTDDGLTVYDGFSFKIIGKKQGLKGSSVTKIIGGKNGLIWAATNDGGMARINYRDSLSVINFSNGDGLISDCIFDICEDNDNKLWLGQVGGVSIIEFEDSTSQKIKKIENHEGEFGSQVFILSLEPGQNGTMWLGSNGRGLYKATPAQSKQGYLIAPSIMNYAPGLTIWDILTRKDGELWLATNNNGVIKLNDEKITGEFNKNNGLPSNQIMDLMEDKEGNSWFASFDQGIMIYYGEEFVTYNEKAGIYGTQILDVLFTENNLFYIATEEGLLQFKKEGNNIRRLNYFTSRNGLNDIGANAIGTAGKDRIWVGTYNGINILKDSKLSAFSGNDRFDSKNISSIFTDSHKNTWIATTGGYAKLSGDNLFVFGEEQGLINDEVQTIIEDKKGRIGSTRWNNIFGL